MLIPFIKSTTLHNEVTHSPIGKDLFYRLANTTNFPAFPPRVGFAQVVGALGEDVVGHRTVYRSPSASVASMHTQSLKVREYHTFASTRTV